MRLFISYAKKDARTFALNLRKALAALPHMEVWLDESLEAGHSWAQQIQQEIDRCDCMIALLTPDVNRPPDQKRSFVLNEVDYAQNANKLIIPVLVQQTTIPVQLAGLQYVDFTASEEEGWRRLVTRLGCPDAPLPDSSLYKTAGAEIPAAEPAGVEAARPEKTRLRTTGAAVLAIAVLLVLGWGAGSLISSALRDESATPATAASLPTPTMTPTDSPTATPTSSPTRSPTATPTEMPPIQVVSLYDSGFSLGFYGDVVEIVDVLGTREYPVKYTGTAAEASTVWAQWKPVIQQSGLYEISVYVPHNYGTTEAARYRIRGLVGDRDEEIVVLCQSCYANEFAPLGVFELDASDPQAGVVFVNNLTGEADRRVAFSAVYWNFMGEE